MPIIRKLSLQQYMRNWCCWLLIVFLFGCTEPASLVKPTLEQKHTTLDTLPAPQVFITPVTEQQAVKLYFNKFIKKRRFNGHILVAKDGEVLVDTTVGYKEIRKRIPLKPNHAINLASVTKPLTATVILQLIQEGKLALHDTITQYLPELPEHYSRITIQHLLAHQSGLSQYYYYCDHLMEDRTKLIYNDTVLCVINFHNPGHYYPPGKKFNYCNTNYLLLASIIENIEQKPYHQTLKHRIFDPLGMNDSFVFDHTKDNLPDNLVFGHTKWNKIFDFDYLDGIVGDKGLFSTAKDLLKFDNAINNGKLLPDSIWQIATQAQSRVRYSKSYGLGWRLKFNKKLGKVIYHTGWWHGNRHVYLKIPYNGYTIIILSNALRGSIYNLNNLLKDFDFKPNSNTSKSTIVELIN